MIKNAYLWIVFLVFLTPDSLFAGQLRLLWLDAVGAPAVGNPLLAAFEKLPCTVVRGFMRDPQQLQDIDVVVLGSELGKNPDYRTEIYINAKVMAEFLERGGVILDFSAAHFKDYFPYYLPPTHQVKILSSVFEELHFLNPQVPLGAALARGWASGGAIAAPGGISLAKSAFRRQRGFRVLSANDPLGMHSYLIETSVGAGRAYLCTLPLDGATGEMSIGFRQVLERLADGMAQGVRSTVDAIHEGKLAPLVADLGADVRTPFSWRVIVLPDTQCYVDVNKANNEKHIHRQTEWIVQEKDRGDIRYVLQLGDLTQHNSPLEWAKIRSAMSLLNGKVPYLVIPGNHDIGPGGNAYDRSTLMAAYFPVSDAIANSAFKGSFKKNEPENVYHIFSAGGVNWLLIGLEFGPRDEVVRWAQKLVDDHPGHRLILVTHAYLYDDNSRFDYKQKGVTQAGNPQYYHIMAEPGFANDGEQLWRDVVSRTKQPSLVLCGHVLGDGLGYLESTNRGGKKVGQLLVNFQQRNEGGEGYLRILEFSKDSNRIRVMDYSPSLDQYLPGSQSQFLVELK